MAAASTLDAPVVHAPLSDAAVVRVAIFSTYPPREPGIGTFSFDVRSAPLDLPAVDDVRPVGVVGDSSGWQRPGLSTSVRQGGVPTMCAPRGYSAREKIDVVLLEHEFGIFGSAEGEHVLSFAGELTQPRVVTLHTVLSGSVAAPAASADRALRSRATGAGVTVPFDDALSVSEGPSVASVTAIVLREAATETPRRARSRPTALPPPDPIDHCAFDPTTAALWQPGCRRRAKRVGEQ